MRPLLFEEPSKKQLSSLSSTYLWGHDFLITPILKAGVKEKEVYFPATSDWFDFYSGEGSHKVEFTKPYIDAVTEFLKQHDNNLTVLDLGCGDFNIGQHLLQYTQKYMGIDIVPSLIERNKNRFKAVNLEFHCLDISKLNLV